MQILMTTEAVTCFRFLTCLSWALSIITDQTFDDRMRYLAELVEAPTKADEEGYRASGLEDFADGVKRAHEDLLSKHNNLDEPPEWCHLIPQGPPASLRVWHFHKGDADPHPSVPHGHEHGRDFPKLDPYLGWIHVSTSRTCSRLSKNDTRALWNNDKFRDFASAALVHFAQEKPNWSWRVSLPHRLPRRR